jgi:hypothetical protein
MTYWQYSNGEKEDWADDVIGFPIHYHEDVVYAPTPKDRLDLFPKKLAPSVKRPVRTPKLHLHAYVWASKQPSFTQLQASAAWELEPKKTHSLISSMQAKQAVVRIDDIIAIGRTGLKHVVAQYKWTGKLKLPIDTEA